MRLSLVLVLVSAAVALVPKPASAAGLPWKQSNCGDSISQGFDADDVPSDQPQESWVQGTDPTIASVYSRYLSLNPFFEQEPESVTGAELVGGGDNFAAQASRVCAQTYLPTHVSVMLGSNDVCNRAPASGADATANMYSLTTWSMALRAGLDQLAACLPEGATVQVMSMPRVDKLYAAGHAKSWWCSWVIWPSAGICPLVTNETKASRRQQIGLRVNQYNALTAAEVSAYDINENGRNPRALRFVSDWRGAIEDGAQNTSLGAYVFSANDINIVDCFHPNRLGQRRLACAAWASNPDGSGDLARCTSAGGPLSCAAKPPTETTP